ncbi:MAG: putative 3-(3-hydroxy-phenyl)propionate hydroxylase, FAD/NAD(P)-binding [Mycobacterium sp.]|nr:putative 3-(3-hydroxy-phenyl)propionate hydroxylase, FAD/NAD(P)-binding [Mycobacterium sp.]
MEAVRGATARCEVAVVGLGPVGAVLSALLGERGIDVIAIEPDAEPTSFPRAIAADDEMLRTLLRLPGLANAAALFERGRVEVRDAAQRLVTSVNFDESPLGVSGLSFFHQPTLERALRAALAAAPSVQVRYGRRAAELIDGPDGIRLGLDDGSAVAARYVVGCDGATSAVRRLRKIPYTGRTFSEPWLVIDVDSATDIAGSLFEHLPCFTYVLDRRRPAVNMPRPGGHRFEFMLLPGEDPQTLAAPASVEALLEPYLAPLSGAARQRLRIARAAVYTFHSRAAQRWRDGRVLLAGDAAHCMPPFGGQGLGAGIGDALALAWRLDEVVRDVSPPRILDGYEAERRPRVAKMNRTALVAGRLLTAETRAGSAATTTGLRLINATPWIGAQFRAGALRAKPSGALPNPRVHIGLGDTRRLDDVLAAGWALLGRGDDPSRLISKATLVRLQARSAATLAVLSPGGLARGELPCRAVEDLDGSLLALWSRGFARRGSARETTVLVSPNRFIVAVGDARAIESALARLIHI